MIQKENIYNNMIRLIKTPSVSGTDQEMTAAYKLIELLYEIPYFNNNRENVQLVPLVDDPFNRSIVTAYLEIKPGCLDTVILTGHFDVVDVEEYGHLKDIAYDVEAVTKRINEMPLDEDSKKDFESGEWLFGRGTADMKFGHVLCLELLKHYSQEGGINGNILYVAVCGEETNSEGMLRAVSYFNELKEKKGLNYKALLLTECYMMEDQINDTNRYIHFGASGKIMPMFFFVGESTHGGEPFLGVDPNLMATEVYKELHLNSEFCQQNLGETTPPPVCLKMQDLKSTYSVSTPLYTASYYNIVTINLDPEETINKLKKVAEKAFENSMKFMKYKTNEYTKVTGSRTVTYKTTPRVKIFSEIYQEVKSDYKGNLEKDLTEYVQKLSADKKEIQDICILLVKKLYELYKDKGPVIIVSIIPPYYPDVYPDKNEGDVANLIKYVNEIISYAKDKYDENLKLKDYYMGISDMCYTGLSENMNFDTLFENLVGANMIYHFPKDDLKKFKVPGIVLGGYGKDFHKHTERLNIDYNLNVLPDLYDKLIKKILK